MDDLDDDDFYNFTLPNEQPYNVSAYWDAGLYGSKVHLTRGLMSIAAIVPNLFVFFLVAFRRLLWKKLNLLLAHVCLWNILFALVYCIYSFVKFRDSFAPESRERCLALTWFIVITSFGPTWAVTLILFARTVSNVEHIRKVPRDQGRLTIKRLLMHRIFWLCVDVIMASLIVKSVGSLAAPTHCTYHYMLDRSLIYLLYNMCIGASLIFWGCATLLSRLTFRLSLMREAKNGKNLGNTQSIQMPPALWKKPNFLMAFFVLAVLFVIPRAAFLARKNKSFWLAASVCPLLLSFVIPFLFLSLVKDLRLAVTQLFSFETKKIAPARSEPVFTLNNCTTFNTIDKSGSFDLNVPTKNSQSTNEINVVVIQ